MKSTSPSPSEEGERRGSEEHAAGFVLFRGDGRERRYLLLRHRGEEYWAFPKGKVEAGEDTFAAAVREVFEETSIDGLQPIRGFCETSRYHFSRNGETIAKHVDYFLAETADGDVSLSSEHSDFRWLSFDDALHQLTYEESRRILRDAEERLLSVQSAWEPEDVP